jgi:hypothetical protein
MSVEIVYSARNEQTFTLMSEKFLYIKIARINARKKKTSFRPNTVGSYTGNRKPPGEKTKNEKTTKGVSSLKSFNTK